MVGISTILSSIKLTGGLVYFVLTLLGSEEKWNKVTRIILAIVLLILSIITVLVGLSTGNTLSASTNFASVFIWLTLTGMGISRLREEN